MYYKRESPHFGIRIYYISENNGLYLYSPFLSKWQTSYEQRLIDDIKLGNLGFSLTPIPRDMPICPFDKSNTYPLLRGNVSRKMLEAF